MQHFLLETLMRQYDVSGLDRFNSFLREPITREEYKTVLNDN